MSSSHSRQLSFTSTLTSLPRRDTICTTSAGVSLAKNEWPRSSTMPTLSTPMSSIASSVRAALPKNMWTRGSFSLYSIANCMSGAGLGHRAHALDRVVPELRVVDLERVVEPVLAGPELDVLGVELVRHLNGLLAEVDRLAPEGRIGVGEAAHLELAHVRWGVMAWARMPGALQCFTNLPDSDVVACERVVDVENLDVANVGGALDRLQGAHGRAIGVGGIAVDELLKHPDACAKT